MTPCNVRDIAVRPDGTVTYRGEPILTLGDADSWRRNEDGTIVVTAGSCETVVDCLAVAIFKGPQDG